MEEKDLIRVLNYLSNILIIKKCTKAIAVAIKASPHLILTYSHFTTSAPKCSLTSFPVGHSQTLQAALLKHVK